MFLLCEIPFVYLRVCIVFWAASANYTHVRVLFQRTWNCIVWFSVYNSNIPGWMKSAKRYVRMNGNSEQNWKTAEAKGTTAILYSDIAVWNRNNINFLRLLAHAYTAEFYNINIVWQPQAHTLRYTLLTHTEAQCPRQMGNEATTIKHKT